MNYYTIGLAGHIDHGKTTLTGALTGVDTDRLKEEKERNISIEPGFAPFQLSDDMTVSIIDVPGHERFIRQMIAGVAGIDLVVPVVAADEGVMPQTREHLEILSLLGIQRSVIAITKADMVEEDMLSLVQEDILEYIKGTGFEGAKIHVVDGKSGRGVAELKNSLHAFLINTPSRNKAGALRLPIDQVFTLQGHGTIARGTIFDGELKEGELVTLLPDRLEARVRQIQTHSTKVEHAFAGQRVAVNLAGPDRQQMVRGQVIVNSNHYPVTSTIDLSFTKALTMSHDLKQRAEVTVHIGTAEVRGTIVFFDRNTLEAGNREELFCQIRLHEPITAKKGDRVIIRRPSPVETIGGGSILNVAGEKYKFGTETIAKFEQMLKGSPAEQLEQILESEQLLSKEQVMQQVGISEEAFHQLKDDEYLIFIDGGVTSRNVFTRVVESLHKNLQAAHERYPMRKGPQKAEVVQELKKTYPKKVIDAVLSNQLEEELIQKGPYLSMRTFQPSLPAAWKTRMTKVLKHLEEQGVNVSPVDRLIDEQQIPDPYKTELKNYMLEEEVAVKLTDELYVHEANWKRTIATLKEGTDQAFTLQEAKDVLHVSRKYLVPILEKLDNEGYTVRKDQERYWRVEK